MPTKKKNYTLGRKGRNQLHDLTLPSGATCQARRPGVQGFIAAGVLDSFDQLTSIVQVEHVDKNSTRPPSQRVTPADVAEGTKALLADSEKMNAGFQLIDRLAAYVVTEPAVWIDYQLKNESDEDWAKRQAKAEADEAIAISDVDLEDRIFLVNWAVGGSNDLAAFRQGLADNMGSVAAIEGVSVPTE